MDLHLVSMTSSEKSVLDAGGVLVYVTFLSMEDAWCSSAR